MLASQTPTYFWSRRAGFNMINSNGYLMFLRLASESVGRNTGIVNNKSIVKFSNTLKVSLQATYALQRTKDLTSSDFSLAQQDETTRRGWWSHIVQSPRWNQGTWRHQRSESWVTALIPTAYSDVTRIHSRRYEAFSGHVALSEATSQLAAGHQPHTSHVSHQLLHKWTT